MLNENFVFKHVLILLNLWFAQAAADVCYDHVYKDQWFSYLITSITGCSVS